MDKGRRRECNERVDELDLMLMDHDRVCGII